MSKRETVKVEVEISKNLYEFAKAYATFLKMPLEELLSNELEASISSLIVADNVGQPVLTPEEMAKRYGLEEYLPKWMKTQKGEP